MSMKISFKKLFFELCIMMPLLFTVAFITGEANANKGILVHLITAFVYLNRMYIKRGSRMKFLLFNSISAFYIIYTAVKVYPAYVLHSYFYTYFFLIIMMLIFKDKRNLLEFHEYFLNAKKRFYVYMVLFAVIIVYFVIFSDGLHQSLSLPVLYGPFKIPHYLAYILLVLYCGIAVLNKETNNKIWAAIRGVIVVCTVWTAVRSVTLALVILIAYEFVSLHKFQKKMMWVTIAVVCILFLAFNTDILFNNPIMEKTFYAIEVNGSLSNNREWFRQAALSYYSQVSTVFEKIFGMSMAGVVRAEKMSVGYEIHAHNDYVNVLVGYGIIGFLILLFSQLGFLKSKTNRWGFFFLQVFIFILSYYNGFALYTMLTASLPIILLFFLDEN